jgi:transcription-repair coupling factor (superfamily II helicase)
LIPDSYVESIAERLSLYTQLDNCENEEALLRFESSLIDRFGPIPKSTQSLLVALRARWTAQELGFERLILKNKQLRLYFVSNPDSPYFVSETFKYILTGDTTANKKCATQKCRYQFHVNYRSNQNDRRSTESIATNAKTCDPTGIDRSASKSLNKRYFVLPSLLIIEKWHR